MSSTSGFCCYGKLMLDVGTRFPCFEPAPDVGPFPAGLVRSLQTNDFDELASAPPLWDQQYSQLGRGRFDGSLTMAHTTRIGVGFEHWSPGIMIRGSLPRDSAAIAIPLHGRGPLTSRGEVLPESAALVQFSHEE